MSDDTDSEDATDERPHRATRLLAVVVAASVIGATIGTYVVPPTSLGPLLVAPPLILLALGGVVGTHVNEPIVTALAGLGLLLVLEPLIDIGVILLLAAIGFIVTAGLMVFERIYQQRSD